MSDVSVVISDLSTWLKSGTAPASLGADAQKLLTDVDKYARMIAGAAEGAAPDLPGVVANTEALIAALLAVAASKGTNLPADFSLFVSMRNLAAGLEQLAKDAKTHAALLTAGGS